MVNNLNNLKFYIYPYRPGSHSARALANALGGRVLRREGSSFLGPNARRKVINWGAAGCPWEAINNNTEHWSNKLSSFQSWSNNQNGPRLPDWTTSPTVAQGWLQGEARVVCRGTLTGHSGAGITVVAANSGQALPQVPLYVKYIPKDAEYRCHAFKRQDGTVEIIDVQRKVRDPSREPVDWQVRSHANGFIFTRSNQSGQSYKDTCPQDVLVQAQRALECSGLTFGAVDVIWNEHRDQAYVLEVNTAPGLEGATVQVYANAIRQFFGVLT